MTEPSATAARNRQLPINALPRTGFTHYPCEWWHWQPCDRHWIVMQSESLAISSPAEKTLLDETARGHSFRRQCARCR
ncbi:D-alanyl-D-alanine dipeptidase [Burkholderia ambifaria]|nr:M15 family metallopeptidase [Burkholderia ambifaria]UZU03513.1 D-alanyl-D-alanine dipeptidase [Burkholderia ambifaria]UZU10065.1 D-alanyl-D-alanine dipeptidase [Burkholderia ambifaria]WDS13983.1 M15 family metallopeptidase [Burkholderia ambifaria]WDS27122.1 M15 family metallopeptidase [Burkholderia ambifaria]